MTMNHKPVTRKIVKDTWEQILSEHLPSLDPDWIQKPEVLVGIMFARPPTEQSHQ